IPTALLNLHYCGDWTGLKAEAVTFGKGSPLVYMTTNGILLLLHNFAPPIFPFAHAWDHFVQRAIPASVSQRLHECFEAQGAEFKIGELQMEETSGLGMGLSVLLLWALIRRLRYSSTFSWPALTTALRRYEILVSLGAWVAAAVFTTKSGLYCPARYLLPFY